MQVSLGSGKYVVAVSGGIDSVSLLHALRARPAIDVIVAHFDHGIRPDSGEDRRFVEALAASYGLPFYCAEGRLGPDTGEAAARRARYAFLRGVLDATNADAIVTAHHQDDVLETAVINLLRGTGRKGLSALKSHGGVERPLLYISKAEIADYARVHRLEWREDSTNTDEKYLRNYIRRRIVPRLDEQSRSRLLEIIANSAANSDKIDTLLVKYLSENSGSGRLVRRSVVEMPHAVAREVMAAWLRDHGLRDFDRSTLERLVIGAKTARAGSRFDVRRSLKLRVGRNDLALIDVER